MENTSRRPIYIMLLVGVLAVVVGVFLAIQAAPLAMAGTTTNALTANVVVSSACYTLASSNPLSFGTVSPGTSTFTNTVATDNDVGGNAGAYFYINGANMAWLSNTILVGNTLWSQSAMGSYAGNALTTTFANTFIFIPAPSIASPTSTNNIYFGIKVPSATPNGIYTQTITFNNLCATSTTNALTANVLVPATCFTTASVSSITFGTMSPGSTYNTNVLVTDNDVGGNYQATLYVEGTDWSGAGTIGVSNTVWNPTSASSYIGNGLTTGFVTTNLIIPAPSYTTSTTSNNIYFGMNVVGGAPSGTYTQTITLENSC